MENIKKMYTQIPWNTCCRNNRPNSIYILGQGPVREHLVVRGYIYTCCRNDRPNSIYILGQGPVRGHLVIRG